MKQLVLISFIFVPLICKSQVKLAEVDHTRLPDLRTIVFLQDQLTEENRHFSDIEASLFPEGDVSGFRVQPLYYSSRLEAESVWSKYIYTAITDAWDTRRTSFNLLYSKSDDILIYPDEESVKILNGQLIILNLKFFFGLYKIPMAFIITRIDKENMIIEFSYIKGNPSEGKQVIQFHETKNGSTRIDHISYYKSKSFFRDKLLYPYFHKKVIDGFHRNMRKKSIEHQD